MMNLLDVKHNYESVDDTL